MPPSGLLLSGRQKSLSGMSFARQTELRPELPSIHRAFWEMKGCVGPQRSPYVWSEAKWGRTGCHDRRRRCLTQVPALRSVNRLLFIVLVVGLVVLRGFIE